MRAWILSLLLGMLHGTATPWSDRLPEMADAIATVAEEAPLWPGEEGPRRTAAVLVALAQFESALNPEALGDCKKGEPRTIANCQSLGAWQVSKVHAPAIVLLDPLPAARVARGLIAQSLSICRSRPLAEQLGWFAWGRTGCDHALDKSRHRMQLAGRLLRGAP